MQQFLQTEKPSFNEIYYRWPQTKLRKGAGNGKRANSSGARLANIRA